MNTNKYPTRIAIQLYSGVKLEVIGDLLNAKVIN